MKQRVLLDTGPLVAYLKRQDRFHRWAKAQLAQIQPPLLTCEAVMVEACFLLRDTHRGQETVISLLRTGRIQLPFHLAEEAVAVEALIERYQSVPISLADACLVRMAELYGESEVLTLDSDFRIYRKHRNRAIPLIAPENQGQ